MQGRLPSNKATASRDQRCAIYGGQHEEAHKIAAKKAALEEQERAEEEAIGDIWWRHFAAFREDPTQYEATLDEYDVLLEKSMQEIEAKCPAGSGKKKTPAEFKGTSHPIAGLYALLLVCLCDACHKVVNSIYFANGYSGRGKGSAQGQPHLYYREESGPKRLCRCDPGSSNGTAQASCTSTPSSHSGNGCSCESQGFCVRRNRGRRES
jgi:hypothetical protein